MTPSTRTILCNVVALALIAPAAPPHSMSPSRLLAQQPAAPEEASAAETRPCTTPGHRQFDFWIGEWDVTWPRKEAGTGRGVDRVRSELDGCVIYQEFDGGGEAGVDLQGISVSVYDPETGLWRQTWVDDEGGYLDFEGELRDGEMTLSREATRQGERFLQRMVYFNIARDSFDWRWERSDDGGRTWTLLWPIHYERKR